MKKQFKNKNELDAWMDEHFPVKEEKVFVLPEMPDEKEIVKKLLEEGYDPDNLTANGEEYDLE